MATRKEAAFPVAATAAGSGSREQMQALAVPLLRCKNDFSCGETYRIKSTAFSLGGKEKCGWNSIQKNTQILVHGHHHRPPSTSPAVPNWNCVLSKHCPLIPPPPTQPLVTAILLSVPVDLASLGASCKWGLVVCPFATGLFPRA